MRIVPPGLPLLAAALAVAILSLPATVMARSPAARPGTAYFDVRVNTSVGTPRAQAASAAETSARRSFGRRLGSQGVFEVDPATGTPRVVTKLNGALTGPSDKTAPAVVLQYVRENATAFGINAADLDSLRLVDRQTTPDGLTTLRWVQVTGGVPAFDSGLRAAVDRAGRVITVSGSPAHDLTLNASDPAIPADSALRIARRYAETPGTTRMRRGAGGPTDQTTFADGSSAALVAFALPGTDRLAWNVLAYGPAGLMHVVVDSTTGRVLHRSSLTDEAVNQTVYNYYPGSAAGTQTIDLGQWLNVSATTLVGPNAHAYADLNDAPGGSNEEVTPGTYPLTGITTGNQCSTSFVCSWDSSVLTSWQTNKNQNAEQVFYFVNKFHDHLAAAPIGFTSDTNGPAFAGSDPVLAETDDGAATGTGSLTGGPDCNHLDNANMSTPPNGNSPTMQMYLFADTDSCSPTSSGLFRDINGGDDAAIVYHEYTHGLSNRLVVDGTGAGALNGAQAGAMGEAWSDWYAMDYLNRLGYQIDDSASGQVDMGAYTDAPAPNIIRTEPLDCPVSASPVSGCPGTPTAGTGGYTYGDLGRVCSCGPEVHADGEIWGQTLWQLRQSFIDSTGSTSAGSDLAEQLVTDGMRLSPPEPSFLDMRNAILAADTADFGGAHRDAIWSAFAARGMGFFASTLDDADTAPVEDFSSPPASGTPTGTISGRVIDTATGLPLSGAPVSIGGHATKSATGFDYFATMSGSGGAFSLGGIPAGTYPQLTAAANNGYDRSSAAVTVPAGGSTTATLGELRDWAASSGGATVASFTGPDNTVYGCGPDGAIDQSQGTGWGANNPARGGATPSITIQLPKAITVSSFEIDPNATCGDGASATLKNYKIETSPDGTTWATAVDASSSGGFSPSDAGHLTSVNPTGGTTNVRYVRVTLYHPQIETDNTYSGYDFIDLSEFEIRGGPPNVLPSGSLAVSPSSASPGQSLAFDATGITDPDSAISAYHWDFNGDGAIDQTTSSATTSTSAPAAGSYTGKVTVDDYAGGTYTASAAYSVASSSTPTTTTPTTTTPIVTPAAKVPTFAFTGTQPAAGRTFRIRCDSRCFGTAQLLAPRRLGHKLGLRSRRFGVKAFTRAGKVTVMLNTAVRRAARRHHVRRLRLTLKVSVTTARGVKKTFTRIVTLRP